MSGPAIRNRGMPALARCHGRSMRNKSAFSTAHRSRRLWKTLTQTSLLRSDYKDQRRKYPLDVESPFSDDRDKGLAFAPHTRGLVPLLRHEVVRQQNVSSK